MDPFIKWAGGKRCLLEPIISAIRKAGKFDRYVEPFVGGGAVFLSLAPTSIPVVLNDANAELIDTYRAVRDNPEGIIEKLKFYVDNHDEEFYYKVRDEEEDSPARFIYLNRACFNGLYRVNRSGKFNVPYGKSDIRSTLKQNHILAVSSYLKSLGSSLTLLNDDFASIEPSPGDLFYIDPPYDEGFTAYTRLGFDKDDQFRVYLFCKEIDKAGGKFLVSNRNTDFITSTFKQSSNFLVKPVDNVHAMRHNRVNELLIGNYEF